MASSSNPPSHSPMNSFDDVFHPRGDDDDINLDETIDFDDLAIEMESKSEIQVVHADVVEEQRLSQKLIQLAAPAAVMNKRPSTSESTDSAAVKKLKTDTKSSDEHIPPYLQAKHRLFDQTMNPFLERATTSMTIEDLREIALIIHNLRLSKLLISQWQTYLLSGTGQLKVSFAHQQHKSSLSASNVFIWPSDVKKMMLSNKVTTARNESEIDAASCLAYTENYLDRLRDGVDRLQAQFNDSKRLLIGFTHQMEQAIEQYIFQYYMDQADLRIQNKVVIVEYNYRDRLLDLEFEHLRPNDRQLRLYRELHRDKCEYEKSKAGVDILKQHVFYKEFPDSFDSFRLPFPEEFQSISDQSMRHALYNRYQRIVQQTKSDMMLVHVAVAEAKMRQYQENFDRRNERLKEIQNDPFNDERLSSEMIIAMQRRFNDYEERMRRLYNLKVNFFVKAPAVSGKNF